MDSHGRKRISKRLSYVLRHDPGSVGLRLDDAGWVDVEVLLAALGAHGAGVSRDQLGQVVAGNDKQRFVIDGDRIRANQGHSIPVDLGLEPATPPRRLYHGTAQANTAAILIEGLRRGRRHHVHLSTEAATARRVGARHGTPVVFTVEAAAMEHDGHLFYRSANGVWLTETVAARYLTAPGRD